MNEAPELDEIRDIGRHLGATAGAGVMDIVSRPALRHRAQELIDFIAALWRDNDESLRAKGWSESLLDVLHEGRRAGLLAAIEQAAARDGVIVTGPWFAPPSRPEMH